MQYIYKFWSVENNKGNGEPRVELWNDYQNKEYNKMRAVYGLQCVRPNDRKKYDVLIYEVDPNWGALFKGTANIVNHVVTRWNLNEE